MKGQFSLRTCKCSICEVNILAEPRISECLIIINYAWANTAKKVVSVSVTVHQQLSVFCTSSDNDNAFGRQLLSATLWQWKCQCDKTVTVSYCSTMPMLVAKQSLFLWRCHCSPPSSENVNAFGKAVSVNNCQTISMLVVSSYWQAQFTASCLFIISNNNINVCGKQLTLPATIHWQLSLFFSSNWLWY